MSIMRLLADRTARCSQGVVEVEAIAGEGDAASPASSLFSDIRMYIGFLKESIDSGRLQMEGQTIVTPSHPFVVATARSKRSLGKIEPETIANELASLALCPDVFVWAPDKLVPGFVIICPACAKPVSCSEWAPDRPLHILGRQMAYITKKYICYRCEAKHRPSAVTKLLDETITTKTRKQRKFQADSPEVLASLPEGVRAFWPLATTGRILCDASVVDFVRALATRTSWAGIAEALNEIQENAWRMKAAGATPTPCSSLRDDGSAVVMQRPAEYRLSAEWVRNVYLMDWQNRKDAVTKELVSETGDDVLVLDWTIDAAARCNADFLFNVMDGGRHILLSALTQSCSPHCVKSFLKQLQQRGVRPKVVYVDCECCGLWKTIVGDIWPGAYVRLDGMHAIRRLTQTVTSTQHPWHGPLCAALSNAIYTSDAEVLSNLRAARCRDGLPENIPTHVKSKLVPRTVVDMRRIAAAVEAVLDKYTGSHATAGALLTAATNEAWRNLRPHIDEGCLCDPPGVDINKFEGWVSVGGERFRTVRTMRGASALEGFHAHQKRWLGCLARHALDAGSALLADGAWRWNRKRRRDEED